MIRSSPVAIAVAASLLLVACSSSPVPGNGASTRSPSGSATATRVPSAELRVSTAGWTTDFSRFDVPLDEIISGGPGKDGIPAIDAPTFEPAGEVDWLEPQEPVIAVGIGDAWRAYPIQVLIWHEIVNDTLGGQPLAVTFCPLCHTAIAFSRELNGAVLDFGTTGNLRHSDLVMYDRQTESWWQQATGRAIVGELTGSELTFLPSQLISWEQFGMLHPDGEVLSRDTGHARSYGDNPYAGYDELESDPFLLEDRTLIDGRLSPKVRVLAISIGEDAVAYPFPELSEARVVNDKVGPTPLVAWWTPGTASGMGASSVAGGEMVGSAVAFERRVDGRTLTFEPDGESHMRDRETATRWDLAGVAVEGELAGAHLQPVTADSPFWFAWAVFAPETRIWQP